MANKKTILMIGLTGRIGPGLLKEFDRKYNKYYSIIIGYHKTKPTTKHTIRQINLTSIQELKKAMKGVHTVINLAANANQNANFNELIEPNIIGVHNILQAAKEAKVQRVITASSVHAIRGYPIGKEIKSNHAPKPLNFYGATKVFAESLCYIYSQNSDLSCIAIRIGAYIDNDMKRTICLERKILDYVISQRDLAQLIHKTIQAKKSLKYAILAGTSNNSQLYMSLKETTKLTGYKPQDNAFRMCEKIKNPHQ